MENEFDDFEDPFADIDGVDWDEILSVAPSVAILQPAASLPQPASPASSDYHLLDVFYDTATLEEIDELEQRVLTQIHETSALGAPTISEVNPLVNVVSPSDVQASRYFHVNTLSNGFQWFQTDNHDPNMTLSIRDECSPQKKRRFSSPAPRTPSKRNKTTCDNLVPASSMEDFQDELMCPICCDILEVLRRMLQTHVDIASADLVESCGPQKTKTTGVLFAALD
ncbi:hypothetical protein APHAL10511_006509 [Amanita phalloides]|nr:hypothetical protein APHAL10511_006509 [Amanita phalloides]